MNYFDYDLNASPKNKVKEEIPKRDLFLEPIVPFIYKYLSANKCTGTLLDIGSGDGLKSSMFQKMGFEVTGLDGDSKRIEKSKLKYPEINFTYVKIEKKLPFDDNTFDVIFSCSVFQYLDHEAIIKECRRVLKKNGSLIMIENLKNNPITRPGRFYRKMTKYRYHSYPWNHFTLKEIESIRESLESSEVFCFHILSTLSHYKMSNALYTPLSFIDKFLIKFKIFKSFAWLVLLTGKNK